MPSLRAAFVLSSIAWALVLPLTPFLVTHGHGSALDTLAVFASYGIGHLICHQRPERSFHLWTAQLPVCARCTGIYVGAAMASALAAVTIGPATWPPSRARGLFAVAALPTLATLLYEWTTGVAPGNVIRAAAGMPLGAAVAWVVVAATRARATPAIR